MYGFLRKLREQHFSGVNAFPVNVLVNGRQTGPGDLAEVVVIKPDDGFVLRHVHSFFAQAGNDSCRQNIGGGKDAGDIFPVAQKPSQLCSFSDGDLLFKDKLAAERNTEFRQRLLIPQQPLFNNSVCADKG